MKTKRVCVNISLTQKKYYMPATIQIGRKRGLSFSNKVYSKEENLSTNFLNDNENSFKDI